MVTGQDHNIIGHGVAATLNYENMLSFWVYGYEARIGNGGGGHMEFLRQMKYPNDETDILTTIPKRTQFLTDKED